MCFDCGGTKTTLNGSEITNESISPAKLQPLSLNKPPLLTYPVSDGYLEKRLAEFIGNMPDPGAGTGSGSTIGKTLEQFGGGVGKTGAENAEALRAAIASAKESGVNLVQYGAGTYIQNPYELLPDEADGVTIQGVGWGTKIQMSTTVGDAIFKLRGTEGITIRNLQIDCEDSAATGAGGIWVSGNRNRVDNVLVANGDGFSICVIGSYSNGITFVPTPTAHNVVVNCWITGQRRYHSIGAKGALLVAEGATHTRCEDILITDCFLTEPGDYAGNDHGLYTLFRNITCIATGGLGGAAGLHLEGGEDYDDMYVTVENLTVINMLVGTSVSEKSKATYKGQNTIKGCRYAIKSYGEYTSEFDGFTIVDCGAGLENIDTEGVIMNAKSGVYKNITTTGTLAKIAFSNYNGNPANSTETPCEIIDCEFDKIVQASYNNVGSYFIKLIGCWLRGTSLNWYNNVGLRVDVLGCQFINSVINGARVKQALIDGGSRFITSNSAQTAINLTLDNYNTSTGAAVFEGYAAIGANVTIGFNTRWTNITSAPSAVSNDPRAYVQGTVNSAARYITTLNDTTLKAGFYSVWGAPASTGAPTDSFGYNYWTVIIERGENDAGNLGPWMKQTISNLDNSISVSRMYQDTGGGVWTGWMPVSRILTDTSQFASATAQVVQYAGSTFVQETSSATVDNAVVFAGPTGKRYRRQDATQRIQAAWWQHLVTGGNWKPALDAAIAFCNEGNELILPEEAFSVADQITVPKALKITGAGKKKTIITQTTDYKTIFHVTANDVSFQGISFQQTGKGNESALPTSYGAGITFYRGVKGGTVTQCAFFNCGDHVTPGTPDPGSVIKSSAGVYLSGASRINVYENDFFECLCGVNNDDYQNTTGGGRFLCDNNKVYDNYFEDCYRAIDVDFLGAGGGVDFEPGQIRDNIIFTTLDLGGTIAIKITMPETLRSLLVSGNKIIGPYETGIGLLKGCRYTDVVENNIDGAYNGISVYTQVGFQVVRDIDLVNNTITNCTNAGIVCRASHNVTISGGDIRLNKIGILVVDFCFDITIQGARIRDNAWCGISLEAVYGCSVQHNDIVFNGTDDTNGYDAGIAVNPQNDNSIITGLLIQQNRFDYAYSGTTGTFTQTYAVRAYGSYYSSTSNARAGRVDHNYFGRGQKSDSMAGSVNSLVWSRNQTATGMQDEVLSALGTAISTALTTGIGGINPTVSDSTTFLRMLDSGASGGYLAFGDGTGVAGNFVPTIRGKGVGTGASNRSGLLLVGVPGEDGTDDAVIEMRGFASDNASNVANANPVLLVRNGTSTDLLTVRGEGSVKIAGRVETPQKVVSSNYTLTGADGTVLINAASAAVDATLPNAGGCLGAIYEVIKTDATANVVRLLASNSQNINSATFYSMNAQWKWVRVKAVQLDATPTYGWVIVGNN